MFCPKCGQEINDDAQVCVHCGRSVGNGSNDPQYAQPKTGIGVLCGIFLPFIGLLIMLAFPEGTVARKTFFKSCLITSCVVVGVYVVLSIISFFILGATWAGFMSGMYS
ncbi:MAG: zinc-ribbon domain-containing protein [Clostridia bacterium]|nr:zinc-ribbon domain-containing protein [Clostridia bacterium]